MSWKQQWIDEVLEEIPLGDYRRRVEAELCDHLECQCRDLTEVGRTMNEARAEALQAMGEPNKLQEEYRAAWRRTLPGRLEVLGYQLKAWAVGLAVMAGVHHLAAFVLSKVRQAAALPGDCWDRRLWFIRSALRNLNYSYLIEWLPLVLALAAGALCLARKFRTASHPAPLISAGLCLHWACIAAINGWWSGVVHYHIPFWEAVEGHFSVMARHYRWTFALCILLGVVFGHMSVRKRRSAAA